MAEDSISPYAINYDLTNCDKEPIKLIRHVQPHALMLACDIKDLKIQFISENCSLFLGKQIEEYLGKFVFDVLPADVVRQVKRVLDEDDTFEESNPFLLPLFHNNITYNLIAHRNDSDLLILEIEPRSTKAHSINFQMKVGTSVGRVQQETKVPDVFEVAVKEVKKISGFDRVMLYKFDEEGHGEVIAEALNADLEPYLGIRYPATDIPKQARELFKKNQIRFISDLKAKPTVVFPAFHPSTGESLDQTYCAARGTSPIHIEYLLNMGVRASMTIAIMQHGKLWGLFACHHGDKIWLDYSVRQIVKFMGQVISGHLVINSAMRFKDELLEARIIKKRLLEQMLVQWDSIDGLCLGEVKFTDLIKSIGGAIYTDREIVKVGESLDDDYIQLIVDKVSSIEQNLIWSSYNLKKDLPEAENFNSPIAGVLVLIINNHGNRQFLMWFRKEKRYTVDWAGNPEKSVITNGANVRISPRKSFDKWKEEIQNESEQWTKEEVNNALDLRSDIKEFFLKKYQELQASNEKLFDAYEELDSFSYTVAHDLRAPLRSIKGFSQILSEDYEDKLDDYGKKVIRIILESTDRMNEYIDHILNMARLGKQSLNIRDTDIHQLLEECFDELVTTEKISFPKREIIFKIQKKIPTMKVDRIAMKQVFENIIGNAIKYTRKQKIAEISVNYSGKNKFHKVEIADNGVGFDEEYKEKAFEIFSRLTTDKSFEGTGVGLAIAKKIISKHNGQIDCFSEEGEGAVFILKLPKNEYI